jgi:hypothetical protein
MVLDTASKVRRYLAYMKTTVWSKGQIVLPAEFRLGWTVSNRGRSLTSSVLSVGTIVSSGVPLQRTRAPSMAVRLSAEGLLLADRL